MSWSCDLYFPVPTFPAMVWTRSSLAVESVQITIYAIIWRDNLGLPYLWWHWPLPPTQCQTQMLVFVNPVYYWRPLMPRQGKLSSGDMFIAIRTKMETKVTLFFHLLYLQMVNRICSRIKLCDLAQQRCQGGLTHPEVHVYIAAARSEAKPAKNQNFQPEKANKHISTKCHTVALDFHYVPTRSTKPNILLMYFKLKEQNHCWAHFF